MCTWHVPRSGELEGAKSRTVVVRRSHIVHMGLITAALDLLA